MSKPEKELQNLINICEDAREFYTDAIAQTNDPEMKQLFRNMADIRKGVIVDLRTYMRQNDMDIEEPSETFGGKVNKFLGENIAKWSDNTDNALIAYLEEAEDRCLHSFQDVSNDNDMPADTRAIVSRELETLKKTHDYMRELKQAMKSAA
jgi:uncharacterized protein (TIGR02284 family)